MEIQTLNRARARLLQIYSGALVTVEGRRCVSDALAGLCLPTQAVNVVAVGKAASSMMQGAWESLGDRLCAGMVITKYQHTVPLPPFIDVIEAAHPVADENSLLAGRALLDFVQACDETVTLLVLISGGASALAEVLPANVSLAQLEKINHWLLSQPLTIHQVNRVRKAISMIKGGKLAQHLRTPHCWQLTLSDVPGNDLSVIGSGLLVPDSNTDGTDVVLPEWIQALIPNHTLHITSASNNYQQVHHLILADNAMACAAAEKIANSLNLKAYTQGPMQGEAEDFGRRVAHFMQGAEPGFYIWGGETVVALPASPGRGGRCQQLALAAAIELDGLENAVVLAAGTDGSDGPGDVAGAMVDAQTIQRGQDAGFDPVNCLRAADAGRFLQASGDLIDTGPTGTNVNDLVLALKW